MSRTKALLSKNQAIPQNGIKLLNGKPWAAATGAEIKLPAVISNPLDKQGSSLSALRQPLFARAIIKGSVALLSAIVEVRGTIPGIFVTQ